MAISARAVAQASCHASVSGSNQSWRGRDGASMCRVSMRRSMLFEGADQLAAACFKKSEGSGASQQHRVTDCRMPDGHDSSFLDWAFKRSCNRGYVPDVVYEDSPSDGSLYLSLRNAVDRANLSEGELACSKNFNRLSSEGVGPIARDYVAPERGCVLIATRKLDGHSLYSRSVVLLLGRAENDQDSVRGLVLNKPLPPAISKRLLPAEGMASVCAEASGANMGGPLQQSASSPVSVLTCVKGLRGFEKLMPDLYLGDESVLHSVVHSCSAGYMKPTDARLFLGAVEWRLEDLLYQIEVSEWWEVAEGRSDDLHTANMWEPLDNLYSREIKPQGSCRDEGEVLTQGSNLTERAL